MTDVLRPLLSIFINFRSFNRLSLCCVMATPTYSLPVPSLEFIDLDYVRRTHELIKPFIKRTPVICSDYFSGKVSEAVGHDVKLYFKVEALQQTGAFKVRGALNAVKAAKDAHKDGQLPGVVTQSSGNHGAATAYAAKLFGVKSTIVVPNFATAAKMANMEQYGAEVIKVEPRPETMTAAHTKIVTERGYTYIYPYNQREIIAGQATVGVEFVEDVPHLEAILAPVGGGGLISGVAIGSKHLKPNLKVFGVAPFDRKLREALATKVVPDNWLPTRFIDTHCDALKAHPGDLTFPIMAELLEKQCFDVSDPEAAIAMKLAWQKLKLTIELSSATVVAVLLTDDFTQMVKEHNLRHIGLVLSGGNADLDAALPWTWIK